MMTTLLNVDAHGNRIKTDILVTGFIRQIGKEYKLLIPEDINGICFQYWFIKVSDEWDKEFSSQNVKFDCQSVKLDQDEVASIYGCLSISEGSHSWKIKLVTKAECISIGVIDDDPKVLTRYNDNNTYDLYGDGCQLWMRGYFCKENSGNNEDVYCPECWHKDTILTMTLNMDDRSLRYQIVNKNLGIDKDYGKTLHKLIKNKYRMVVTLCLNLQEDPVTVELV